MTSAWARLGGRESQALPAPWSHQLRDSSSSAPPASSKASRRVSRQDPSERGFSRLPFRGSSRAGADFAFSTPSSLSPRCPGFSSVEKGPCRGGVASLFTYLCIFASASATREDQRLGGVKAERWPGARVTSLSRCEGSTPRPTLGSAAAQKVPQA